MRTALNFREIAMKITSRLSQNLAGLPFNVARLYIRMGEGIREGKSFSPDFDVAVKRQQFG
jgi:hypothetical protein